MGLLKIANLFEAHTPTVENFFSKIFQRGYGFQMEYPIICFDLSFSSNHNNLITVHLNVYKYLRLLCQAEDDVKTWLCSYCSNDFSLFSCEGNEHEVNIRVKGKVMFVFIRICSQITSHVHFLFFFRINNQSCAILPLPFLYQVCLSTTYTQNPRFIIILSNTSLIIVVIIFEPL